MTAAMVTTTNPPDEEPPHLPLLLRIEEVMRELSISRRTVYELIKDGKLHLVRVGVRGSRIRTEEVLQLAGTTFKPLRIARLRNQQSEDKTTPQGS
jgi:excisionase family DNA binding protein